MPLDPQAQVLREERVSAGAPPLYELSLDEARRNDLASIRAATGDLDPVAEVGERTIPGPAGELTLRTYRPHAPGPLPVLLYFFGGGWTLGSIDTADGICRRLANAAGCITACVGYRLAPENKFPAAVDDCYAAFRWIHDNPEALGARPGRVAIGGDSAGGNLAAAVSLISRTSGGPLPDCQVLVYPNTDLLSDTRSLRENDDPFLFNRWSVAWYIEHYLDRPEDATNPLASPLRAPDVAGLPPTLVITAEYDPLLDQAEEYAHRLDAAGVPVTLERYEGMMHGFFAMPGRLDAATQATTSIAAYLRSRLAGEP